jgi:hypothetical protein
MTKALVNITLPKDKSLLRVLLDMKFDPKTVWIFIDEFVYRKLKLESRVTPIAGKNSETLTNNNFYPSAKVVICSDRPTKWKEITELYLPGMNFRNPSRDPEKIFFITSEIPY